MPTTAKPSPDFDFFMGIWTCRHRYPRRLAGCRTWDPDTEQWSIHRLDSRHPGRLFPPVRGGFDKGVGTFLGDDECDGCAIRVRFLWSRITDRSARWEQAFSLDEGNSWETNWIMISRGRRGTTWHCMTKPS